jgi:DNA primase
VDLGDQYIDKEALRGAAPLALVAAEVGVRLDENGEGLCPFHNDTRPSFRLWTDDRGIERWGCFPCGLSGDVYDLVQRMEAITFPEALNRVDAIVKALPPNTYRPAPAVRPEFDAAACEIFVADALHGAELSEGWLCVVTELVPEHADPDYRVAADKFIREQFRWGVDQSGNVVMPHYDAAGRLTGAKVRALDGRKWSFPGSTFGALYGAWRPRRSRYVMLTEGEGDCVYAAMQAPPVDVL